MGFFVVLFIIFALVALSYAASLMGKSEIFSPLYVGLILLFIGSLVWGMLSRIV